MNSNCNSDSCPAPWVRRTGRSDAPESGLFGFSSDRTQPVSGQSSILFTLLLGLGLNCRDKGPSKRDTLGRQWSGLIFTHTTKTGQQEEYQLSPEASM